MPSQTICNECDFFSSTLEKSETNATMVALVLHLVPIGGYDCCIGVLFGTNCGYDGEHPRRLNFRPKWFAWRTAHWRTAPPVYPTDFNVTLVQKSLFWNSFIFCEEVTSWVSLKMEGNPLVALRYPDLKMLPLVLLACLHHQPADSSQLPHIPEPGSHRPGGSHGPQISVGPYKPWSFSQHKPWGSHPHHQKLYPKRQETSHPGYETNIIIDPYAKVSIKINHGLYWMGISYWKDLYSLLKKRIFI